jgi:uncharacterized membrane protein YadS
MAIGMNLKIRRLGNVKIKVFTLAWQALQVISAFIIS